MSLLKETNPPIKPKVLLLMFTENADTSMRTQMFELFSGEAKVSGVFRRAGIPTVSYDINNCPGKRSMDFLSEGGLRYSFANNLHVRIHLTSIGITDQCRSFPTTFASRLSMLCVMQEVPGAFNLLAPDRGSWTVVSRGTSLRSCINPLGRSSLPFVANGNTTIPRSARFCFGRFC